MDVTVTNKPRDYVTTRLCLEGVTYTVAPRTPNLLHRNNAIEDPNDSEEGERLEIRESALYVAALSFDSDSGEVHGQYLVSQ